MATQIEVYLHTGDKRPWLRSDGPAAAAFEREIGLPGWTLISANDLGVIMREAGEFVTAAALERMEEAHVVRVFMAA